MPKGSPRQKNIPGLPDQFHLVQGQRLPHRRGGLSANQCRDITRTSVSCPLRRNGKASTGKPSSRTACYHGKWTTAGRAEARSVSCCIRKTASSTHGCWPEKFIFVSVLSTGNGFMLSDRWFFVRSALYRACVSICRLTHLQQFLHGADAYGFWDWSAPAGRAGGIARKNLQFPAALYRL